MRMKITPKPDAAERVNDRSLDPTTVMLHPNGKLYQLPSGVSRVETWWADVTDLFNVEVIEEWQVVLTKEQLDAVRETFRDADDPVYRGVENAFSKASLVT